MTEMLNKEFSRKSFVKGGGALVVGFSLAGAAAAGQGRGGRARRRPATTRTSTQVDSWLTLNADNTVTVKHGQPERGHGTTTGFLMLVAEELDVGMDQMHLRRRRTRGSTATGGGGGSGGIISRALPVRAAAVAARSTLLGMAATQLGVPVDADRRQGRRHGRRQDRQVRRPARRQAVQASR